MSGRRQLVVTIMMGVLGIATSACSGSVTGTDLTNGDGGTGGGGSSGLLGGGTTSGSSGEPQKNGTSTSTSPSTPSGSKGGVCGSGDTSGKAACDSCLNASCCASFSACDKNAECAALFTCAGACNGDQECVGSCKEQHPGGLSDAEAFAMCVQGCGECQ